MYKTFKITISGQVQGVGFRPYVYSLATKHLLSGTVSNNEEGVLIYVTGAEDSIQKFYTEIIQFPPPVARIQNSKIHQVENKLFDDFKIIPSKKGGKLNLPLTPDFAICEDCKNDIKNPKNHRYNYPFTTCVNCGPRWAITQTFPFERNHTSIDEFPMCDACKEEYTAPNDRRFHSQTNTCKKCGIQLKISNDKEVVLETSSVFIETAKLIKEGAIIAIKNTSGYLLCCDATNTNVVERLRIKKNRPKKPFAILYPSLDFLQNELQINKHQKQVLTSSERPIAIVSSENYKGNIVLDIVAPGLNQLGVMLPYSGILQLLANELTNPIIATSGNIHGSPIISDNEEAFLKLNAVADYFVTHDLRIEHPQDDSVVKFSFKEQKEIVFRRSRGFAPNYFNANLKSKEIILALGAHLKSCVAYLPNEHLYISQYLGNLDDFDVYNRFVDTTQNFIDLFESKPSVILTDKHTSYQSSIYGDELATKMNTKKISIQHHKAHFAAILGEHQLFDTEDKILGVVWDGTGFGDDQQIWGGEFFTYQKKNIKRAYHFEYVDWLAGDKMAKEPRLSLFSMLEDDLLDEIKDKFTVTEINFYKALKKQNKLKTSSVGRLFDAVASLLNITDINSYEGEAAILLENCVSNYNSTECKSYFKGLKNNTIPTKDIIRAVCIDKKKGLTNQQIITNFLYTLVTIIVEIAKKENCKKIAFSGGVFQNTTLIDMIIVLFQDQQNLYFHKSLSPNDENISFGQIQYYLHIKD